MFGDLKKLTAPLFLFSLALLLLNDLYLKYAWHNAFTGKLSDFAGLFMFPFFISIFFRRSVRANYILTVLIFIWWKSAFSSSFIQLLNAYGIPAFRTIDYSDLWALLILPLSWLYFSGSEHIPYSNKPVQWTLLFIAVFATTATTMRRALIIKHITGINKEYFFPIPLRKLASEFNDAQIDCMKKYAGNLPVQFNKNTGCFYTDLKNNEGKDTLVRLIDVSQLNLSDTIHIRTSLAGITIRGNNMGSYITLHSVAYEAFPSYLEDEKEKKKYTQRAIRIFEKEIIRKIDKK